MTQSIERLLDTVSREIKALEIARQRYAQQLAPDFSVFNYIYTDEMMLSRMIADLLDPQGKHAQGEIFLQLFLENFSIRQKNIEFDLKFAKVNTEVITHLSQNQRRMDIYIDIPYLNQIGSFGICIENKPYAADQKNQIIDYAKELEIRHGQNNWLIIYLTKNGNEPSTISIDSKLLNTWLDKKYCLLLSYPGLKLWLKQCIIHSQNIHVTFFLNAFELFITQNFIGAIDMSESKSINDIINLNQDYQNAFEKLYAHGVAIKNELNKKTTYMKTLFSLENKKQKVQMAFHARNDFSVLLSCLYFDLPIKNYNVFIDIYCYPSRYEIILAERSYQISRTYSLKQILEEIGYKNLKITANNRLLINTYPIGTDHHHIHHDVDILIEKLIEVHFDQNISDFN